MNSLISQEENILAIFADHHMCLIFISCYEFPLICLLQFCYIGVTNQPYVHV